MWNFEDKGQLGVDFYSKSILDECFWDLPFTDIQTSRQKLDLILDNKCSPKLTFFNEKYSERFQCFLMLKTDFESQIDFKSQIETLFL